MFGMDMVNWQRFVVNVFEKYAGDIPQILLNK
jgi:hypothetical protein